MDVYGTYKKSLMKVTNLIKDEKLNFRTLGNYKEEIWKLNKI